MGAALCGSPLLFGSTSATGAFLYRQGIIVLLPGEIQIGRFAPIDFCGVYLDSDSRPQFEGLEDHDFFEEHRGVSCED
jgi:hypothetical protein